ncbi:hypothetical protein CC80DRAFT_413603 [Byssothecium circinans]|uniref:Uncharacterized protein n=1 Tax=Byssothecium circinans TaxID=147558 RepID=A0A6A5TT00_9PLEO|nr:hypothetical protein CC80DRAFT_413603 [Byssothecium circinans]
MEETKIWIILGVVVGSLVLGCVTVLALFCARRSKRKIRGFSLRAVTPLDDAEFESWRRPSQYTQRPEKYGIRPTQPAVVRTAPTPNMFEKELINYDLARAQSRTPSPRDDSSIKSPPPLRKPERVRRKSSCASSLADRPPTPYSPASPASVSGDFPRSSYTSRRSYGSSPRTHYPSMSEASAFDFDFSMDFDSHPTDPTRHFSQSTRPLNLSYTFDSYSEKV